MSIIIPGQSLGPERPAIPSGSDDIRRIAEPKGEQAHLLEVSASPANPRYRRMMQPPDPDGAVAVAPDPGWTPVPTVDLAMQAAQPAAIGPAPQASLQDIRAVISFGPQANMVVVGLERAATGWDIADGESWVMPISAVMHLVPLLKQVMRVKDMTGGAWNRLHVAGEPE